MPQPTVASLTRITPSELHSLLISEAETSQPTSSTSPTTTETTILAATSPTHPKTADPLTASVTTTPSSSIAIIDVRGADHIGGHIRSSTHVPSDTLDHALPELVRKLKDKKTVVFHCALSQVRGPGAALRYVRERAEVLKQEGGEDKGQEQEVAVLEGGFVEWQELYGKDERVTEGYVEDIWKEGYWG